MRFEKNEDDGSIVFFLRDEVRAAIKFNSPTKVEVQMWRGGDPNTFSPPDIGNLKSHNFRSRLAREAARKFGKDFDPETELGEKRLERLEDDLGQVAAALDKQPEGEDKTIRGILELLLGGPSVAELLLRYTLVGEYFHDPDGEAYVTIPVGDHIETWSLKSRAYRRWLRHRFYIEEKAKKDDDAEPEPLRDQVLRDVIGQLEAKAQFEGVERCVYVRVAELDAKVYIDLCNEDWQVVEIDAQGWRVVSNEATPVKFVRAKGMAPMPVPVAGEDAASTLRRLLNLQDDEEGDEAWRLILAWLVNALRGRGPYPVLILLGGQGTAKSTAARILRSLVDPSTVPLRSPPKNEHDLMIDSVSSWVIAFDNISELAAWLSDALCRLATGGGYATRTLYTDRDQELFDAMRPAILNGITDVATRPDLLDRALLVNLKPIGKTARREERKIFAELEEARPSLMGYLFSAVAVGLHRMPMVDLNGLPRMADFARWAVATEEALGADEGSFMKAYSTSQEEAVEQALEASAVAVPLWKLAVQHQGSEKAWTGTATELLKELSERIDDDARRAAGWPKAANSLARELKRLAPPLRDVGVYAEQQSRSDTKGSKQWNVFYSPPDDPKKKSSEPSESPADGQKSCKTEGFSSDDASDDFPSSDDNTVRTDDAVRDIVRDESPAKESIFDDSDGSDDKFPNGLVKEKECIHGLLGGEGCYICDPDHPLRREQRETE